MINIQGLVSGDPENKLELHWLKNKKDSLITANIQIHLRIKPTVKLRKDLEENAMAY